MIWRKSMRDWRMRGDTLFDLLHSIQCKTTLWSLMIGEGPLESWHLLTSFFLRLIFSNPLLTGLSLSLRKLFFITSSLALS